MKYLVTSALPYANGPLHIGHLSGAYLSADVFVRHLRLMGEEVVFICGSDEHGAAITMRAIKDGLTPQAIVDKYHAQFEETFRRMGVSFDMYHRTTSPLHHSTSQAFFMELYHKGAFEEHESEQYYDLKAKQFLADRYIKGTCPVCESPDAYGDQCEKCGSALSPTELKNPRSMLTGSAPVMRPTKHWYLPLNLHEDWLREWINQGTLDGVPHHNPSEWKSHVVGQCNSWLNQGLHPRAMTRDLDWGVDVPAEIGPNAAGKKLYVWLDAPIGYISATKQWAEDHQKDWKDYWCNPESQLVHFIGKDNIVFHCLIFPVILKEHGAFNLPVNVPANQFMNLEGHKISTSRNWAVWVHEYLDELPDREDALRYAMIKNMPELRDSEFTWRGFQEANNNELVNNLANFVHRVLVLTHKYSGGEVPQVVCGVGFSGSPFYMSFLDSHDFETAKERRVMHSYDEREGYLECEELRQLGDKLFQINQRIKDYDFRGALQVIMEVSSLGNQLLQSNEPWKLIKTEPERTANVIFTAIQYVVALSVAIWPFLPFTSNKLRKMLNLEECRQKTDEEKEEGQKGDFEHLFSVLSYQRPLLSQGHKICKENELKHLFTRITDEVIAEQMAKLVKPDVIEPVVEPIAVAAPINYKPMSPEIQFDDFAKIDLRTGTITAAERIPKADKLLKLNIDLGFEQRTILSGIATQFAPEDIIGQQVVIVANLAPRTMRGIESQGMVLMAENEEGKLSFVAPNQAWVNGFGVK